MRYECIRTIRPNAAPPNTSHAELTRKRMSKTAPRMANRAVAASKIAARPSCQVTTAIKANDAALTPSKNAPAIGELRKRGISRPLAAISRNDGRNIRRRQPPPKTADKSR